MRRICRLLTVIDGTTLVVASSVTRSPKVARDPARMATLSSGTERSPWVAIVAAVAVTDSRLWQPHYAFAFAMLLRPVAAALCASTTQTTAAVLSRAAGWLERGPRGHGPGRYLDVGHDFSRPGFAGGPGEGFMRWWCWCWCAGSG